MVTRRCLERRRQSQALRGTSVGACVGVEQLLECHVSSRIDWFVDTRGVSSVDT